MTRLDELEGVGKTRLSALHAAGIDSLRDLLCTFPIRYRDTSECQTVDTAQAGRRVTLRLKRREAPKLQRYGKQSRVTCLFCDDTGDMLVSWFNQPWMKENLLKKTEYLLFGLVTEYGGRRQLVNPSVETELRIQPIYRPIDGLPQRVHQSIVKQTMDEIDALCPEELPVELVSEHQLCGYAQMVRELHFPTSPESLANAQKRYAFEQFLLYQAAVLLMSGRGGKGVRIPSEPSDRACFWSMLPFLPTGAQHRALEEIAADLSGEKPMARMVQGDVGCGKTAIAFGAMALTAQAGYQAALMAPTVILARQHYEQAKPLFEKMGFPCVLLVGGMTAKERREALTQMETGEAQIIIGTHALVSAGARYQRLGLVITDEQHRFGVEQRTRLICKGDSALPPNLLVMSATPIPRSLALILYGDLELSVVDELPPGRQPVTTRIVPDQKREDMYRFLKAELDKGRQAYIVCPLVEDSEAMEDVKAAKTHVEQLQKGALAGATLTLVHGRMPPKEKEQALSDFSSGIAQVLVATTVIEVGVNVPNATIMVIEDADHYGLAQLHQIRGRVGRGSEQSWCFLMAKPNERLRALTGTNDGFAIAQEDLKQRGPGELLGTRQHGDAALMDGLPLSGDTRLLSEAAECAKELYHKPERALQWEMVKRLASAHLKRVSDRVSAS